MTLSACGVLPEELVDFSSAFLFLAFVPLRLEPWSLFSSPLSFLPFLDFPFAAAFSSSDSSPNRPRSSWSAFNSFWASSLKSESFCFMDTSQCESSFFCSIWPMMVLRRVFQYHSYGTGAFNTFLCISYLYI